MVTRVSTQAPPTRRTALLAGFTSVLGIRSPWAPDGVLERVTLADLYPGVDPDELDDILPLTRTAAMRVPAIAKARHTVVGAIAGNVRLVPLHPMARQSPIFRALDPGRPNVITLGYMVDSMFFHGRTWLEVLATEPVTDRPLGLRWTPEEAITFEPDGVTPATLYGARVNPSRLILVEHIAEGVLSPAAGLTVRRARRTDAASARAMDNPVPSVELHQTSGAPLPDAEVDKLIRRWSDARRGRNGGVAYTSPAIEAKMHGQAAEQLLINGRNASALDCARVAGVPGWAVDASVSGSSLTYSNVPSRSRELLDYSLRGYLEAIVGRLSMDDVTPHGHGFMADVTRLLRGDFTDRMTAGKMAVEAGIYTAEEIAAMDSDTPTTPLEVTP